MKIEIDLKDDSLNKTYYKELESFFVSFLKSECIKGTYTFDD